MKVTEIAQRVAKLKWQWGVTYRIKPMDIRDLKSLNSGHAYEKAVLADSQ